MKSILDFLESPLVVWAKTVLDDDGDETKLNYEDFTNGYYFYLILKRCDPQLQNLNLPNDRGGCYDFNSRLLNLDFLLRSVKSFYASSLNQLLLCKLPDIYQIVRYQECGETFKELEKILVLLLGCAINGDYKEQFIDNIQQKLETHVQVELVSYLELVTEDINFSISKNFKLVEQQQQQVHSPDSSISSTSSFIQSCQQLMQNQQSSNHLGESTNDLIVHKLLSNIQRICDERDLFMESNIELQQDKNFLLKQLSQNGINGGSVSDVNNDNKADGIENAAASNGGDGDSPSTSHQNDNDDLDGGANNKGGLMLQQNTKQQKLSMELVECKVKMRQLRMEIEEKSEQIETLREEINTVKCEVFKLKNENIELNQRAALANIYSEEIESLRERALKCDKYENEMNKFKEKLEEFNLMKLRLEEFKDENLILLETRTYMEKQIDEYQVRISQLLKNENEMYKYKQELNELVKERDVDKHRIRELMEKTTKQELEIKNFLNENHNLNEEMQYYKNKSHTGAILTTNQTTTTVTTQHHVVNNQHAGGHGGEKNELHMLLTQAAAADANTSSTDLFSNNFEMQATNSLKAKVLQLELDKRKLDYEISVLKENEQKNANELSYKNIEIEQLSKEIRDLNLKLENINLNTKLESNETEKIKELSLQLIKLQFDEKQLRKLKFDEENETLNKLRENEEQLHLKLEQIRLENENLVKVEKSLQQEMLKLKEDYEKCYNENYNQQLKVLEFEQELKKQHKLNESLKNEIMEYVAEKELSEEKLRACEKEIFKLKQQLDAKNMSLNESANKIKLLAEQCKEELHLRKKIADCENEIDVLKRNYRNLELENEEKNERLRELERDYEKRRHELTKQTEILKQKVEEEMNIKESSSAFVPLTPAKHQTLVITNSNNSSHLLTIKNYQQLLESHENLNNTYQQLLHDHEQLQTVYIHLENDCEGLIEQLNKKNVFTVGLTNELALLKEEYIKLNATLKEPVTVQITPRSTKEYASLNDKYEKVSRTYEELKKKSDVDEEAVRKMSEEIEKVTVEAHKYKQENNETKLENTKLLVDMASKKESLQLLQFKMLQIQEKCQTLEVMNEKLEDEKAQLFEQLHILLQQNQELLTQALNSKDVYHEQTKTYMEQLNNLRRQKESLESKIMEQYKKDPSLQKKKKPGFIQQLVQKVRTKSSTNGGKNNSDSSFNGNHISHYHQNSSDEFNHSNTMENDSIEIEPNSDSLNNSQSSFAINQRNLLVSKSPMPKGKSQSPGLMDEIKLNALSRELAASANALNDIGMQTTVNTGATLPIQRKYVSNDNLIDDYDESASPTQQQISPTESEVLMIEKAKSDSYMKYLDLQQQQQQLLLTPNQAAKNDQKMLKLNRSINSSPSTTTSSTNYVASPSNFKRSPHVTPTHMSLYNGSNTTSQNVQKRNLRQNFNNLSPKANELSEQPMKSLKPISIILPTQHSPVVKSASPSPSPKANEIWLEYGCI